MSRKLLEEQNQQVCEQGIKTFPCLLLQRKIWSTLARTVLYRQTGENAYRCRTRTRTVPAPVSIFSTHTSVPVRSVRSMIQYNKHKVQYSYFRSLTFFVCFLKFQSLLIGSISFHLEAKRWLWTLLGSLFFYPSFVLPVSVWVRYRYGRVPIMMRGHVMLAAMLTQ